VEIVSDKTKEDKPGYTKLLQVVPKDPSLQAFKVQSCSVSTIYEEANDKIWSVICSNNHESGKIVFRKLTE
jgi:hypothetical protein